MVSSCKKAKNCDLQNLHCLRDCLFQECSAPIAFTQCKALAEFLISSHDNQQVSAWVQQEKQNVGGELHFLRHLTLSPRRNSTKEGALWIDSKFCVGALCVE
jgi:4-alpha-glucanotransferase